ncbi:hypothetical protein ABTE36_22310, partial [Acinetobacter baumannii]
INGGLAKIIAFTSSERVSAQALSPIETTVAAPPLAWALMENAWNNSTRGYPRAVTINKQRLYYANSFVYPQTVWGSVIRGYLS